MNWVKKQNKKKNIQNEKEYCINPEFLNLENTDNLKNLVKELKQKYPKDKSKTNSLILEKSIEIEDSKYDENSCLIYLTPEELKSNQEPLPLILEEQNSEIRNERKMTNSGLLQKLKVKNFKATTTMKKKEGLSEKEIDNIKEIIKDYVVKIFKSEEVNLEQKEKTDLLNKLNLPFGREFFISLLSKNTSNVILLKENSFHLLWMLIYHQLIYTLKLEETSQILQDIVNLIKCSTYFGIQEEGKTKTLFEKYIGKIQDFTKIKQDNFWQMWYELELKKNEKLKDDNKYKQSIIYDICETLIKLEMPKSMVIKFTKHIDIIVFGEGSDLQQETFKEIVNRISHAKYISKII